MLGTLGREPFFAEFYNQRINGGQTNAFSAHIGIAEMNLLSSATPGSLFEKVKHCRIGDDRSR